MLWVAGAGLVTSISLSLVVFVELREQPLELIDAQIQAAASAVGDRIAATLGPAREKPETTFPFSWQRYWITAYGPDLRSVYRSDLAKAVALPPPAGKGDAYTIRVAIPPEHLDLPRNDENHVVFRVGTFRRTIAGEPYWIQIAEPLGNLQDETYDLLSAIAIGLAVSAVLLMALSYLMAGRIVRPVATINRLAREIDENSLEKRIPPGKSRDEIYELAACLNRMFDRLQFSFVRQKRLLADASHELKSPLAMLRLFFDEAAQRVDLPEDFRRQLDGQSRNVLRMDRLVKTLLELTVLKIAPVLTMKRFDIAELTRQVASEFSPVLEAGGIRLETEMPDRLAIDGDPEKIRRMLINIFDNAVRYNIPGGRIALKIEWRKGGVRLSLGNTGPGIPEEDLPRVFDQFYRVDKSRSIEHGGAGLGLAIVMEIVRLHHGRVAIESRPGLWTSVEVFFTGKRSAVPTVENSRYSSERVYAYRHKSAGKTRGKKGVEKKGLAIRKGEKGGVTQR